MDRRSFAFAALLAGAAILPAASARAAEPAVLNVATGGAFTSLDPHYHNLGPNNVLADYVFSTLTKPDPTYRPMPSLATSWTLVDPTTWELKLRDGVTFHDGTPFTADDVVFSFGRIPMVMNSPASFTFATKPVTRIEVVDAHTIRMHTASPMPLLPFILFSPRIVSRKYGEGAVTADYNSMKAAIGTGPYKITSFTVGDRAVFRRNEAWFEPKPVWETVNYRLIANDAARSAALQAGDVDAIDAVPSRDVARLRTLPAIDAVVQPGQRLIYLNLDSGRPQTPFVTGADGKPLAANPLRDARVRKALSLAINREGIRTQIMDGLSTPTGQLLPEGASGYDPTIKPDPYDPAQAKRLLAEAGFPDGFGVKLLGPNDRYVNDRAIVEAIAQMWTRIGVRTTVDTMPAATFFSTVFRDEFSVALTGWSSDTGEASSSLVQILASSNPEKGRGTVFHPTHYANPKVDELVERSMETLDTDAREALYRQATELGIADTAVIPIHLQMSVRAFRKGLTYRKEALEGLRAVNVEPTDR
jgi:peptide/nickel transport system substrate-binding protein